MGVAFAGGKFAAAAVAVGVGDLEVAAGTVPGRVAAVVVGRSSVALGDREVERHGAYFGCHRRSC